MSKNLPLHIPLTDKDGKISMTSPWLDIFRNAVSQSEVQQVVINHVTNTINALVSGTSPISIPSISGTTDHRLLDHLDYESAAHTGFVAQIGGTLSGVVSFGIRDTSAAFDVTIAASSSTPLTAGHTLTLDLVNADRTLKLTGNSVLNQDVTTTASPTFSEATLTGLTGSIITTAHVKQSIEDLDDSFSHNEQSGLYSWGGAGNYWSTSGANFSLLRPGTGYIKGKKITWTATQTIAIPSNTTKLVCIDNTGTIQVQNEDLLSSYRDYIPLFLALYDGTQTTVSQEHHYYGAPPRVVTWNHETLGVVVTGSGANIARVTTGTGGVVTDRELKIVGADILYDLMLTTTIPDSAGAAVSFDFYYTDVSGHWIRYAQQANFPMVYDNAGVVSALTTSGNGHFGVFNIYVAKSSDNTATPVYLAVIDNARYNGSAGANTAITNGTIAFATNELASLQICHLGYVIVTNNVGGGFISTAIVAKSTANTQLISGGGATAAALITVDTSTFVNFFTAADNTVQNALNTIDATLFTDFVPYTGANTDVDLNNHHLVNINHLGIGTSLTPDILLRVVGDNGSLSRIAMRGYSNDANSSEIRVTKFRGTEGSPLVPQSGDSLGRFQFAGYSGLSTDGVAGAVIQGTTTELWTATANGTKILFKTTPNGSATPVTALTIDQDKSITCAGVLSAINGGTLAGLTKLAIRDTSAAFDVIIAGVSSTALTADRTLTIDTNNVSSILKMGANLTVVGASSINGTIGSIGYLSTIVESNITLANNTTNDVSTTQHGFAPKAPNDATKFLNGANPPAWTIPTASGLSAGPAFFSYLSTDASFTPASYQKMPCDTVVIDTSSCYDNTTNFRFTPTVAGNYLFAINYRASCASGSWTITWAALYKNGSIYAEGDPKQHTGGGFVDGGSNLTVIATANGTTDYFEAYVYFGATAQATNFVSANKHCSFMGTIIDVQGTHGSNWYTGSGAPSTLHDNGDFYLNTSNGDVYKQVAGAWGSPISNITGPQGAAGSLTGPVSSVDSEIMLFSGTGGNLAKRAAGTGVVHVTSGVYSASAVVESDITLANNTTNDVSTTQHGFAPKAPNDATQFLNGTGSYSVPSTGQATGIGTVYDSGTIGGSGAQDLTTNGSVTLDGNTHKGYYGELVIDGTAGAATVSVKFENDGTASHYLSTLNFSVASNNNNIISYGGNDEMIIKFQYSRAPSGRAAFSWTMVFVSNAGPDSGENFVGSVATKGTTISNITRIDFHSGIANGFGPNSRLRIWSLS